MTTAYARALVLTMTISVGCGDGAASAPGDVGELKNDASTSHDGDADGGVTTSPDAGVGRGDDAGDAGVVGDAGDARDVEAPEAGTSPSLCGVPGGALFCEGFEGPL